MRLIRNSFQQVLDINCMVLNTRKPLKRMNNTLICLGVLKHRQSRIDKKYINILEVYSI